MKNVTFKSQRTDRLDKIIAEEIGFLTRQKAQQIIKDGLVTVLGKKVLKSNYKIKEKDKVVVTLPKPEASHLEPQDLGLDIVHEDKDYLVVNKPTGMVVHPAPGHKDGTLVNAILYHLKGETSKKEDPIRPGILHRLDKDTSGIVVVAKNDQAHLNFAKQMEKRTIGKTYIALVHGKIDHKGVVEAPIGRHHLRRQDMTVSKSGKEAITEFEPIKAFDDYTLLKVKIKTGRTHQIRVHLAKIGYPVVGDKKYGKKDDILDRQFLHAKKITFQDTKNKKVTYETELPQELTEVIERLTAASS